MAAIFHNQTFNVSSIESRIVIMIPTFVRRYLICVRNKEEYKEQTLKISAKIKHGGDFYNNFMYTHYVSQLEFI